MQLPKELIALGAQPADKCAAITQAAKLLSNQGKIDPAYLQGMLTRETQENTYLGKGVAIPHGTPETRHLITETAVAVVQVPDGVTWNEKQEKVQLVIAIAADGDEHLQLLRRLTRLLSDDETIQILKTTTDPEVIQQFLADDPDQSTAAPPLHSSVESNDHNPQNENQLTSAKVTLRVTLPNPLGLHARPATRLTKIARSLSHPVVLYNKKGESACASELMALLSLGLSKDEVITIKSDSQEAAEKIAEAITSGLGDELTPLTSEKPAMHSIVWTTHYDNEQAQGMAASDGLAYGRIYRYEQHYFNISNTSCDPYDEAAALDWAIAEAARTIYATMETVSQQVSQKKAAIFNAHLALLNDETIIDDTTRRIANGDNAALAYKTVLDNRIAVFETQPSALLAARSADLRDVRDQVLKHLLGIETQLPDFPPNSILCAEHLTPAVIAHLPHGRIFGIITADGTPNDHNAIIARGMGLPMIVGVGEQMAQLKDGDNIIMDGNSGMVYLRPTEKQLQSAAKAKEEMQSWLEQALVSRMQPGHTADGKKIDILANINKSSVASAALDNGAEGVGLMRTESLFLKRDSLPSEEEQTEEYLAMAKALGERPLLIRTLDIGDQKRPTYLTINHQLGGSPFPIRGIGLSLKHPDWIIPQLRAICRARCKYSNVKVMFPMVATIADWQDAKALLEEIRSEINAPPIETGAMIELPSAALLAHQLASEVDFFSIGINDLSRYTLNSQTISDALHPAVLRLIDLTVRAAKFHHKPVSICGAAAGDVNAAKIFVGLGIDQISVRPPQIAPIKQALRESSFTELVKVAQQALSLPDASAVRTSLMSR